MSQNGAEEMQPPLAPLPEQKFYGPNYHMTTPSYPVAQVSQLFNILFLTFSSSFSSSSSLSFSPFAGIHLWETTFGDFHILFVERLWYV